MSDRLGPMPHDQLETELADLAMALAFPPTPDLAAAVGSRLRAPLANPGARPRLLPFRRSVRRSLLLAAALVLLVVGGALAVRFGGAALDRVRAAPLRAARVGGPARTRSHGRRPRSRPAAHPGGGRCRRRLRRPPAAGSGPARRRLSRRHRAARPSCLRLAPRDDLPESALLGGAGLLVTQNRGGPDDGLARKIVDTSAATVQQVDMDGSLGVWISGQPHLFWYLAPDGSFIQENRRLVGDTLAWERDGVLYRIEGAITLSRALEIARSMR